MAKYNSKQLLDKAIKHVDRLSGNSKRKYQHVSSGLHMAGNVGIRNIPKSAVTRADRLSKVETGRVLRTRITAGVGAAAVAGAGFLGLHKYHQHRDNKILERIDKMGKND